MRTIRFAAYLFYRYYSRKNSGIAYFSTITALALLVILHLFQLLIVFHHMSVLSFRKGDGRIVLYWKSLLLAAPFIILISLLIRPKDLQDADYKEEKIKRGYYWLIAYIVLTVVSLFWLMAEFPQKV